MLIAAVVFYAILLLEICCALDLDDVSGISQRLPDVLGDAIVSALESTEQVDRNVVLNQIDRLQSLATVQDRLAHQEEALEAGSHSLSSDINAASSSPPQLAAGRQVLRLEQLAPLPLRLRRRRLQALLSYGAEAHHKEQDLLQALMTEQTQLELRAQALAGRGGTSMLAFPRLPSIVPRDGGSVSIFDGAPAVEAETLLQEQALISTLSSHEGLLAKQLNLLARRPQSHAAKSFFMFLSREPLESLPLYTGFNYFIVLLLLTMIFCPLPLLVKACILSVILFVFAYFLLGRGFPADIESPMVIDWCLRVLGCLYVFFFICIIVQICRECFCPPPPEENLVAGGDDPIGGVQADVHDGFTPAGASGNPVNDGRHEGSMATDHDRVEANRRAAAEGILLRAQPIVIGGILILVVLSLTGMIVYVEGFYVWSTYREESCDQPLAMWLICTLVFQTCAPCINFFTDSRSFNTVGFPVLVGIGFALWENCTTCHETNPYLYHYVQLYLIYNLLMWITYVLGGFGLVGLALWMQSLGLVSGGQQPAPGLIEKMETIPFRHGMQPAECCICQEDFAADGKIIARTPCCHVFHKECLGEWLDNFGRTCPLCRKDLEKATSSDIESPVGGRDKNAADTKTENVGMSVNAPAEFME